MTHVVLNGEARSLDDTTTLAELLAPTGAGRGCAVAVNGVVVPRAQLADRRLADGDVVEVVTAVQGG
ncbi:sulfur carrier protein ThiS [Nocardioides kribbensis]|uniref:sulfur carrier protein ThiS n=1 Tax=Nocardioides kribbensis TaxID=305517 RepID=UPI0032DB7D80